MNGAYKEALFYNRLLAEIARVDLSYILKEISAETAMARIHGVISVIKEQDMKKFDQ